MVRRNAGYWLALFAAVTTMVVATGATAYTFGPLWGVAVGAIGIVPLHRLV